MSPERLLALAASGLPPRRAAWGAAMRAELAAIADPDERRRFARGAAAAAFVHGYGLRLAFALAAAAVAAAVTLAASRAQLSEGGPGVLGVTVLVPPVLLFLAAAAAARITRSRRFGVETGFLALAACFVAVSTMVALEGLAWMDRHGVFVLDADPPRHPVGDLDVMLDLFTTGMWLGHLLFWLPWPLIGPVAATATRHGNAT